MQKIGLVEFKEIPDSLNAYVAYYSDDLLVTRIDVYDDYENYDVLNTEHCRSSYFKDSNEYYLGDDVYVQRILKIITKVAIMPGERTQTVDVVDGSAIIEVTKTFEEKNGTAIDKYVYKQKLIDGELTEEVYQTPWLNISFGSISDSTDLAVRPVNFFSYNPYGGEVFKEADTYSSAEYYTVEELFARYPGRLDHLNDYDMVFVMRLWTAIERLKEFEDAVTDWISVDIESTGLGMGMYAPDCITGVVLSFSETQSTYYPFRQEGSSYNLPIWFMSVIINVFNAKAKTTGHSCTFNGKMEIESFWKEKPSCIKFSNYALQWKSTLYENLFNGTEASYSPTSQEKEFVLRNKFAQQWIKHPEKVNDGRQMTIVMNDDGLHTSIKIDQNRERGVHKLKTLSEKITGKFWLELDLIFKGQIRFNVLPPELIRLYACPDTMNTIRVCKELMKKLPVNEAKVLEIENKLTYVKAQNEFFGLPMNSKKLNSLIVEDSYIKDLLEKRFREIHRTSKNIRSNPVKADIFYNRLKAPILLYTNKGAPSASNAALDAIVEAGKLSESEISESAKNTPSIAVFIKKNGNVCTYDKLTDEEKSIVDYENEKDVPEKNREIRVRTVIKGKDLYSNKYPSLIMLAKYSKICKELGALDRLKKKSYHDKFQFYIISDGADSDRQTSDAHQFSDTMKKCVVADSRYHKLISCDYKQIELRVLAFLAGAAELMELMKDSMVDIHRAFIQMIDGTPMWAISAEVRNLRKRVNFGVVYGISEWGLVKQLHGIKYTTAELLECAKMILDFYNGLPEIKQFKIRAEQEILENAKVETAFGFIRYLPKIKDPSATKKDIAKAVKAGSNTKVQGFAATLMKKAECNYNDYIIDKGWDELVDCDGVMLPKVRLMLSIHDEILISSHESIPIEEIILMCKVCQEIPIKGAPPFFAAPAFVDSWYDGKLDQYEIPIPLRDKVIEEYKKGVTGLVTYDNYVNDLNAFRKRTLEEYMNGLIKKYVTPEEVAKHVQHPDLTHVLISGYVKDDVSKITDHMERINVAVERYMSGETIDLNKTIEVEEETDENQYLGESESIGKYIYFNDDGEQMVEYADDDTKDEFEVDEDDMSTLVEFKPKFAEVLEEEYVFYGVKECMIDITDFYTKPCAERIHQAIVKLAMENPGKYDLMYIAGTGTAKVGYKVGYILEQFNMLIREELLKDMEVVA